MKKYVVLSVNDNVDYLYFTPLTCWAWRKFGWEPIVFYNRAGNEEAFALKPIEILVHGAANITSNLINNIEGYRSDTITQISRLYGACVFDCRMLPEIYGQTGEDDYLITGDIDMIPLSDYWQPNKDAVTVYGHDLTGFTQYPICYIGMPARKWREVMQIDTFETDYNKLIKRDLDTMPQAKDLDFYQYWVTDQALITKRLKEYGTEKITFINRGQGKHGFARGRVDKGNGGWVLDQPELIDAHLLQQCHHSEEKIHKLMNLLHHVWPQENWKWFLDYTKEFKKLAV